MKRRKLRRSRGYTFRQKRQVPGAIKFLGGLIVCVAVVAAGFFGAKYLNEQTNGKPAVTDNQSEVNAPAVRPNGGNTEKPDTNGENTDDVATTPDEKPNTSVDAPAFADSIRAFYLPASALADALADSDMLADAYAAGFNAVVFDLKDAEGNLYYQFTNSQAKKVGYADGALTATPTFGIDKSE